VSDSATFIEKDLAETQRRKEEDIFTTNHANQHEQKFLILFCVLRVLRASARVFWGNNVTTQYHQEGGVLDVLNAILYVP